MQPTPLADLLKRYLDRAGFTIGLVGRLSGVPKPTIVNWREGRVTRPRTWHQLAKVAAALRLTESEASEFLIAGGWSSVATLREHATADERVLLAEWDQRPP